MTPPGPKPSAPRCSILHRMRRDGFSSESAPDDVLKLFDLAHNTRDDGFHEIQLNGKQLVFVFMAATVVSVVIFLCGVLVGRGVRAERAATVADQTAAAIEPAPQAAAPVSTPAGS